MKRSNFKFTNSVPIDFGYERVTELGEDLKEINRTNPLIVTDSDIFESGVISPILNSLENHDLSYETYTDVKPNPKDVDVEEGTDFARSENCDSIIAVGGGSSIDTGKAIAVLTPNKNDIHSYWRSEYGTYKTCKNDPLPIFTVPTTVGTGSEVTSGFVVTDTKSNKKRVAGTKSFAPQKAILDPSLLETLPTNVIASTGMDSLTQAIESYISPGANPITDAIAVRAVELIANNIRPAVAGTDTKALGEMQVATSMGAIAMTNAGLGLVHGMSHPVSAHHHTPHGLTNGVLLPYVLEYNLIGATSKYANMAELMGVNTSEMSDREAAASFVDEVRQLQRDVGIPTNLKEIGVTKESLSTLAGEAVETGIPNPRDYSTEEVLEIFEKAY